MSNGYNHLEENCVVGVWVNIHMHLHPLLYKCKVAETSSTTSVERYIVVVVCVAYAALKAMVLSLRCRIYSNKQQDCCSCLLLRSV